eukprot:scaffold1307_cov200-Pinguiococcus_pyrenoidosus.AAC.109
MSIDRWQLRYFALSDDGRLNYYEQSKEELVKLKEPRGSMRLGRSSSSVSTAKYPQAPHEFGFEVRGQNGDIWYIAGKSDDERDEWVQKIREVTAAEVEALAEQGARPPAHSVPKQALTVKTLLSDAEPKATAPPPLPTPKALPKAPKKIQTLPDAARQAGKLGAVLASVTMACIFVRSLTPDSFVKFIALVNTGVAVLFARNLFREAKLERERELAAKREADRAELRMALAAKGLTDETGDVVPVLKAGSTFEEAPHNDDPSVDPLADGKRFVHRWRKGMGEHFRVRQPGYSQTRAKAASGPSLYECVAIDVIRSAYRRDHIASEIQLPKWDVTETGDPAVPPFFIINVQLPEEAPSVFASAGDGPTVCFAMWLAIRPETVAALRGEAPMIPGLRCFQRWCRNAETDSSWMTRFKAIGVIQNWEDVGSSFGSFSGKVEKLNGKPVLIRRNTKIIRGEKYMEYDANVHNFGVVSRQALWAVQGQLMNISMNLAFLIESRDEDELPEVIVGCAQYCRLNLSLGVDVFHTYKEA